MPKGSFAQAINPSSSRAAQVLMVVGSAALTAVAARFQVPIQPVPFTLQTFVIFTASMLLGARLGTLGQAVYLGCGAAGLGVFAGAAGGLTHFAGPTGGYLISYIPASFILGRLADRGWSDSFGKAAAAMGIGAAVVFGLGVAWLTYFVGFRQALVSGCLLFLPSEAFKIAVGAMVVSGARSRVG